MSVNVITKCGCNLNFHNCSQRSESGIRPNINLNSSAKVPHGSEQKMFFIMTVTLKTKKLGCPSISNINEFSARKNSSALKKLKNSFFFYSQTFDMNAMRFHLTKRRIKES